MDAAVAARLAHAAVPPPLSATTLVAALPGADSFGLAGVLLLPSRHAVLGLLLVLLEEVELGCRSSLVRLVTGTRDVDSGLAVLELVVRVQNRPGVLGTEASSETDLKNVGLLLVDLGSDARGGVGTNLLVVEVRLGPGEHSHSEILVAGERQGGVVEGLLPLPRRVLRRRKVLRGLGRGEVEAGSDKVDVLGRVTQFIVLRNASLSGDANVLRRFEVIAEGLCLRLHTLVASVAKSHQQRGGAGRGRFRLVHATRAGERVELGSHGLEDVRDLGVLGVVLGERAQQQRGVGGIDLAGGVHRLLHVSELQHDTERCLLVEMVAVEQRHGGLTTDLQVQGCIAHGAQETHISRSVAAGRQRRQHRLDVVDRQLLVAVHREREVEHGDGGVGGDQVGEFARVELLLAGLEVLTREVHHLAGVGALRSGASEVGQLIEGRI
mmetsp:Transcript_3897/g.9224  ORF Transcript_3897/g.9224 Transcript_3897/m.9224 type:complete len:438 (-) Transcript_3897:3761-5074(-)